MATRPFPLVRVLLRIRLGSLAKVARDPMATAWPMRADIITSRLSWSSPSPGRSGSGALPLQFKGLGQLRSHLRGL